MAGKLAIRLSGCESAGAVILTVYGRLFRLHAHKKQTAVTAGEAVTAGQVVGYVDSTGNHLHFEVMQGWVRVDPLSLHSLKYIRFTAFVLPEAPHL